MKVAVCEGHELGSDGTCRYCYAGIQSVSLSNANDNIDILNSCNGQKADVVLDEALRSGAIRSVIIDMGE